MTWQKTKQNRVLWPVAGCLVALVCTLLNAGFQQAFVRIGSHARWETLPDIPTVTDFVPGYEASQWWAIGLRKSTRPEIIERLNRDITAILAEPCVQGRLADLGGRGFSGSAADLEKFLIEDTAKWSKVVKLSGARPG